MSETIIRDLRFNDISDVLTCFPKYLKIRDISEKIKITANEISLITKQLVKSYEKEN